MKKLMLCGALSLIGLFACVESREAEPESDPVSESTTESELSLCCIDFTCVPTGFETTGCKTGVPSIAQAYQQCNVACDVQCTSSGLYCL